MAGATLHPNVYRSLFQCLHQPLRRASNPAVVPGRRRLVSQAIFGRRQQSHPPKPPRNPLDPIAYHRLEAEYRAYCLRRIYLSAGGMVTCIAITIGIIATVDIEQMTEKSDARPDDPLAGVAPGTPIVTTRLVNGEKKPDGHEVEQVPTGSDAVPTFPRTISLGEETDRRGSTKTVEYQLIGLGVRTVSFLQVKVYVVGLYVAKDDLGVLQQALIRKLDPVATTLIPSEQDQLRTLLLDPERGEEIWSDVLRRTPLRTVMRIVPTRNTDVQHLRDGWIRGIIAKAQGASRRGESEFDEDGFADAVTAFKGIFGGGRKKVPAGKAILLLRNPAGVLEVWSDDSDQDRQDLGRLGNVTDERISRLVWLNYLAGKKVASESARRNVVEGLMECVGRPIGTLDAVETTRGLQSVR